MNTTAVVGLVGVLLGAAFGGVLSWAADRRRWKREDRQRWHERRLRAYATTLDRLTRVFRAFEVSAELAGPRWQPPWGPQRVRRQMQKGEAAIEEAQQALFVIQLVGSPECITATERCLRVIGDLSNERWTRASPEDRFEGHLRKLHAARKDLVSASRHELNVDG